MNSHRQGLQNLTREEQLIKARWRAHRAFDALWQNGVMDRPTAYRWLAEQLHLKPNKCHMSAMTFRQCKRTTQLSRRKLLEQRQRQ